MEAFGIYAKFQYVDTNAEFDKLTTGAAQPDAYVELYVFSGRDSAKQLSHFTSNSTIPNCFLYQDILIEKLLRKSENQSDLSDRFKVYKTINKIILEHGSVIPLYHVGHMNYIKKCFKDLSPGEIKNNPNSFLLVNYLDGSSCDGGIR